MCTRSAVIHPISVRAFSSSFHFVAKLVPLKSSLLILSSPFTHTVYPEDVPQLPNRAHLSEHMQRYAAAFKLNMLNSTTIKWTSYDTLRKRWTVKLDTPSGEKNVTSRIFVQATGIGSSKPYVPEIPNKHLYKGINLHSNGFKNGKDLVEKGVKVSIVPVPQPPPTTPGIDKNQSVIVVGSANTAFDVLEDCHNAGLNTTIVARSPTFIFPWEYCLDPQGLGLYEILPVDVVDNRQLTMPTSVAGQLAKRGMALSASKEPWVYFLSKAIDLIVTDAETIQKSIRPPC
jgi:hypothetical protein